MEIKGATTQFLGRVIIFTSNYHPRSWYPTLVYGGLSGGDLEMNSQEWDRLMTMIPFGDGSRLLSEQFMSASQEQK